MELLRIFKELGGKDAHEQLEEGRRTGSQCRWKTRCEVKKLANAKKGWKCFPVALSSTAKSDKNDKDVDDDDDYVNIRRFKSSVMLHSTDC